MAILKKDEFFAKLQDKFATDSSDETVSFIEDMTDTYNYLESKISDVDDWEGKYRELDEAWRKKYMHRFFSTPVSPQYPEDGDIEKEEITIDEILKDGE